MLAWPLENAPPPLNRLPCSRDMFIRCKAANEQTCSLLFRMDASSTSTGWKAAPFVFASIALENMVFLSVGVNLFMYMFRNMHFSITYSANAVTNFMGTSLLLGLFGGFIADIWLSKFQTILVGLAVELLGLLSVTLSASISAMQPPPCSAPSPSCHEPTVRQKAMLFSGLYLVAFGTGAAKNNLLAFGADQFSASSEQKEISTYFNGAFFSFCLGSSIAVTLLVYVQDNVSRECAYAIASAAVLLCILVFTGGHGFYRATSSIESRPFISILQVLGAAIRKRNLPLPSDEKMLYAVHDKELAVGVSYLAHTDQLRFLDKAAISKSDYNEVESPWTLCTVTQVEEVKLVVKILPIFASTVAMSCVLAQLQTFSQAQGITMDRRIAKGFEIPPASLAIFPLAIMILLIPLYDRFFVKVARRITRKQHGISHLQRIGLGLVVAIFSIVVAALVEQKRIKLARKENLLDSPGAILPMKIHWLGLQYLTFGVADMFTLVGLQEFFYSESPPGLRSMSTSLAYVSTAIGYFISSLLVSVVNSFTRRNGGLGWLPDNLNRSRLSSFYWLLALLSAVNLVHYLFWASWYKYKATAPSAEPLRAKENTRQS